MPEPIDAVRELCEAALRPNCGESFGLVVKHLHEVARHGLDLLAERDQLRARVAELEAALGESLGLKVGDLVEAVEPHALVCGSGRYQHAVVVSLLPFALVSVAGDMLWTATQTPKTVRRVGVAPDPQAAFARWTSEKK